MVNLLGQRNECGIFLCQLRAELRQRSRSSKAHLLLTLEQLRFIAGIQNVAVTIKYPKHTEGAVKNGNVVQVESIRHLELLGKIKDQTNPFCLCTSSVHDVTRKLLTEYDARGNVASPENCTASFTEIETPLELGKQYSITLICMDKNNRRLGCGGHVIKPSFTGADVSDVAITDNEDGSYIISFVLRQGAVLEFEVSIDGVPAPSCSLTKQVRCVISDVYGKGDVTDGGL